MKISTDRLKTIWLWIVTILLCWQVWVNLTQWHRIHNLERGVTYFDREIEILKQKTK